MKEKTIFNVLMLAGLAVVLLPLIFPALPERPQVVIVYHVHGSGEVGNVS